MKLFVFIVFFVAVANSVSLRGSNKFADRPTVGDQNGSIQSEYSYIDHEGNTHSVKYVAGPKIGFKILEDVVKRPTGKNVKVAGYTKFADGYRRVNSYRPTNLKTYTSQDSFVPSGRFDAYKSFPGVEVQEIVKVHHLRNEVPATVHKTHVPESIHSMAPPPVFSRRFIVKHDVPVLNSIH